MTEAEVFDALPSSGFLREYVQYAAQRMDCHAGYHILGGLSCLTQTVHPDLNVHLIRPTYPTLYCLVVGPSSVSRKTESVALAMNLLKEAIPGAEGVQPDSWQGLFDSLKARPQQLIPFPEFNSTLLSYMAMYLRTMKPKIGEVFDCTRLTRRTANRKGSVTETIIEKPRLSLIAACTPSALENFTEPIDWQGGFIARWLMFYASKREREYSAETLISRHDPVKHDLLINMLKQRREAGWGEKVALPQVNLGFTPKAAEVYRDWSSDAERVMRSENELSQPAIERSKALAYRIATLLAWDNGRARSNEPWYLTEEEVVPACKIARFHVESVRILGANIMPNVEMRDRRNVLSKIPFDSGVTYAHILHESELGHKRVNEIVTSLKLETVVVEEMTTMEDGSNQALLRQVPYQNLQRRGAGTNQDNVVQLFPVNRGSLGGSAPAVEGAPEADPFDEVVGAGAVESSDRSNGDFSGVGGGNASMMNPSSSGTPALKTGIDPFAASDTDDPFEG